MKEKELLLTLKEAKILYNSNDTALKDIALKAFSKEELSYDYKNIKSLEDACKYLFLNPNHILNTFKSLKEINTSTAAYFKLTYIKKALLLYKYDPSKDLKNKEKKSLIYPKFYLGEDTIYGVDPNSHYYPDKDLKLYIYNHCYRITCLIIDTSTMNVLESLNDNTLGNSNPTLSLLGFTDKFILKYYIENFLEDILTFLYGDTINFKITK